MARARAVRIKTKEYIDRTRIAIRANGNALADSGRPQLTSTWTAAHVCRSTDRTSRDLKPHLTTANTIIRLSCSSPHTRQSTPNHGTALVLVTGSAGPGPPNRLSRTLATRTALWHALGHHLFTSSCACSRLRVRRSDPWPECVWRPWWRGGCCGTYHAGTELRGGRRRESKAVAALVLTYAVDLFEGCILDVGGARGRRRPKSIL